MVMIDKKNDRMYDKSEICTYRNMSKKSGQSNQ